MQRSNGFLPSDFHGWYVYQYCCSTNWALRGLANHPAVPLCALQTGFVLLKLSTILSKRNMVAAFPGCVTRPDRGIRTPALRRPDALPLSYIGK